MSAPSGRTLNDRLAAGPVPGTTAATADPSVLTAWNVTA
jgi:hypothetical protein